MTENSYRTLMEILLAHCPVSDEAMEAAREEAIKSGTQVEDLLVTQGAVPAPVLLLAKAEYLEMRGRVEGTRVTEIPGSPEVKLEKLFTPHEKPSMS